MRVCLRAVRAGAAPLQAQVIVVDNNSGDGTVEMVRDEFPWVDLVDSPHNLGFAAGNNAGLTRASGDTVVFLNPDTECAPGALAVAAGVLVDDPALGMTAPMLLNPDGTLQRSIRRLPTLGVSLLVVMKLHRLFTWLPAVRRYDCADIDYEREQDVEQPMGACLLMPRAVLDDDRAASTSGSGCGSKRSICVAACSPPVGESVMCQPPASCMRWV